MRIVSKTLSEDRHAVTLTVTDLPPCMQLRIAYQLNATNGKAIKGTSYSTIQDKP